MLPTVQEALERSVYHIIRQTAVDNGYLPDINDYDVENDNITIAEAAQVSFVQAMKDIRTEKGFTVEIFNNSPTSAKGNLKVPRIVMDTKSFLPGEIGLDTTPSYELQGDGTYRKQNNTFLSQTSDFIFNLRLLSNNTAQQRVLHGIMLRSLPRRGYIKWYTEDELKDYNNIFIRYAGHAEFNHRTKGINEHVFNYEILDIVEIDPGVITSVPPIVDVDFVDGLINVIKFNL